MSDLGDNLSSGEVTLTRVSGDGGGLGAAIGLSASGLRAAAVLSGAELTASLDLLAQAASRRLPLVVHLTADAGHGAYHAAAATGAALLFASNVQEAADLPLIARRLAETALVPAVVAFDGGAAEASEPDPEAARRYLGGAGDVIHPPTPSQEMLFGKHRRRVPRWHDPERPLLTGAIRGAEAEGPAALARRVCFDAHLPELLEQAFEDFAGETGRRYQALRSHRVRGARVLLVAQGAAVETAAAVAGELRAARGPKVDVVGIRALRPLPAGPLAELLRGHRAVAVLERCDAANGAETPLGAEIRAAARELPEMTPVVYGLGASALHAADLEALCRELADKKAERRSIVYLGLGRLSAAGYPKRQAHLDALRRDYPQIARLGLAAATAESGAGSTPGAGADRTPPPAIRRMAPSSVPLADLAGFGDRAGSDATELLPDPFLAAGALPPLAAALSAPVPDRALLPAFDPALCTGCGDCWSACPDGAVGPLVLGPAALLDQGMRLAARRGRSVDKLRMVKSKLADAAGRQVAAGEAAGGSLGEVLDAAFGPLIDKMKLPDERKAQVREAYGAVREELAALPVARTAPFFDGAGDLLTLAIDPEACKGCGLCVAECEPGALTEVGDSPARSAAAGELWRLCEELPAPAGEVLERASQHPEVGPLAGALLARSAREVMTAANLEAGSGEALAARQVLGMVASVRLPVRERLREQVEDLRSSLAEVIHEGLSQALPDRDLDALARGLEALGQPDAQLAELTERVETAFETERVDVAGTRRLVNAGRELADLAWRLEKGEGGMGRAACGVVLAGSPAAWGGTFPHNPFAVPVTVASTGAGSVARGLLAGQLEQTLGIVRVLRRARAELERAGGRRGDGAEDELGWETLSGEERALCPPLLLLASEAALAGPELGATLAALDTELPLKVFAFGATSHSSASGAPFHSSASGGTGAESAGRCVAGELALSCGRALVARSSIAHFDHLGEALGQAFAHPGPAFVRILAPSPARGGFEAAATLERARAAVEGEELGLWISDPQERAGSLAGLLRPSVAVEEAEPEIAVAEPEVAVAPEPAPAAAAVAELEQRHAAELANLRGHYEAQIAQLHAGLKMEMAHQVRGRLMQLVAGARPAPQPDASGGQSPETETGQEPPA